MIRAKHHLSDVVDRLVIGTLVFLVLLLIGIQIARASETRSEVDSTLVVFGSR